MKANPPSSAVDGWPLSQPLGKPRYMTSTASSSGISSQPDSLQLELPDMLPEQMIAFE
jgi:hypothetical protein